MCPVCPQFYAEVLGQGHRIMGTQRPLSFHSALARCSLESLWETLGGQSASEEHEPTPPKIASLLPSLEEPSSVFIDEGSFPFPSSALKNDNLWNRSAIIYRICWLFSSMVPARWEADPMLGPPHTNLAKAYGCQDWVLVLLKIPWVTPLGS